MQAFNIFEAGGRQKFLKKKKQKKAKTQDDSKQKLYIQMIQRNILRFLQLKTAHQKQHSKLQLQEQQNSLNYIKNELWKYWLLTPYHIRNYGQGYKLIQFWQRYVINRNQVQLIPITLVNRMVKLTIEFLSDIIEVNLITSIQICQQIFSLIRTQKCTLLQIQAKSIIKTLSQTHNNDINKLRKQFLDTLFHYSQTKSLVIDIFMDQIQFLEYLILKLMDIRQNKINFAQLQNIVITCYPNVLEQYERRKQSQQKRQNIWVFQHFDDLCQLYSSILHFIQISIRSSQATLIWIGLLNNLTLQIKNRTLQQIHKIYKINPNIFQSSQSYYEYLDQKDQYLIYRQTMMGDYQKTKKLMKRAIQVIMDQQQTQIPSKLIIYQNGMQYVYEILNILGNVDIVPLNKAINFFIENVNEVMIYNIGKDNVFSFGKKSFSVQNKLLLILTLTQKTAIQTPDLYFIKFYQQSSEKQKLKKLIKENLLKILKHTIFLPHSTINTKKITRITIQLLENLYNKIFRTGILSTQIFENSSFVNKFKSYEYRINDKDQISLFLTQFPYVFPLPIRAMKFREILREQRYKSRYYAHQDSDQEQNWNRHVKIRRNHEFIDAFDQMKNKNLRIRFRITFINQLGFQEKGIDAGGLTKQFLNRVLKDALNPNYGMFIENNNKQLLPHPIKAKLNQGIDTEYYEFIGKLIGLAIYENITLGYKFSGTFLNAIVGKKNTFDDLQTIDSNLYNSLVYIKDMQQDASQLCLTFMFKDEIRNKHIQLLPNGHLINVTNQNKRLYISLLTTYKVNRLLEHQTRFIRKGLTSMVNKQWLFMFNYEELNYLISGQGQIDVDDLKKYTKIIGFQYESNTMQYFWEVVREFTQEQKSKLLMFVTACPRPSFLGFKELSPPFSIICMKDRQQMLPVSHTCSNLLQLPDYNNKELLKKKLLTAIQSNAGFEFG